MILGKPYRGPECDIWSLGVILFSMLTACMPFDDQDWTNFICSIQRADYPEPRSLSESECYCKFTNFQNLNSFPVYILSDAEYISVILVMFVYCLYVTHGDYLYTPEEILY